MKLLPVFLQATVAFGAVSVLNLTYTNPVIPGWHSDPSCVFVPELNNTFFCTTSTLLVFPGIPIYASKNLLDWKVASNVLHKKEQLPVLGTAPGSSQGQYAATLRYHEGRFYLITIFLGFNPGLILEGLNFNSTDVYNQSSWSQPVQYSPGGLDPDLFWDDGKTYLTQTTETEIIQSTIDPQTGVVGSSYNIWNGTGGNAPEGPHMYKKDGYYYLLIAEGGTALNHSAQMARARNISGPYESCPSNPVLTNRNTSQYFQTVGHADLFQDKNGKWWGVALATRSGPEWVNYPMGRETVRYPVTWKSGHWPILQPVRGRMSGWSLPSSSNILPSEPSVDSDDDLTFPPGSELPSHFVSWRFPPAGALVVSPKGHHHTLQLNPSRANLTGDALFKPIDGFTFVSRRQTHTLFTSNVDVSFAPVMEEEETGVTVFLTQNQHIDLGIVLLASNATGNSSEHFRFRTTVIGKDGQYIPATTIVPVPKAWIHGKITLQIQAVNDTHYLFSAAHTANPTRALDIGYAPATVVSGGDGAFTGALLGVYATGNGNSSTTSSYISRWKYTGTAQEIDFGVYSPQMEG